jgi:hypothetical protein
MTAPFAHQRAPALLLTLLLHLGLFGMWHLARQPKPALPSPPTQWLTLLTPRHFFAKPPPPPPPPKRTPAASSAATLVKAKPVPPAATAPAAAIPPAATPNDKEAALPVVAPLEATGRTAADIMKQAKRDLGKIDRDIRDADAKWVRAPASTPHSRMQAAFDAAHDAVPPKWYEAARITEIGTQAGSGARMYKVATSAGTYCIRVASNHSLADMLPKPGSNQDQMSTGIRPSFATCPK